MEYKLDFKTYNEALKKNQLLGLKCDDCGSFNCPPNLACQSCGGMNTEVVELTGKGKIVTYTTVYVAPGGRENEAPFIIVMVELEEGPWIMGNLIDIDPERISMELIGKEVKLGNKVYPGDTYSDGEIARPLFSFVH